MKYCHLIITRYNLNLSFNGKAKIEKDENWYKDRLELFKSIYLKTLDLHQLENVEVKFNIFLNYRFEKLDEIFHPFINKVFVTPPNREQFQICVEKIIRAYQRYFDCVIVTRLDNDDGLHPNYTKNIITYLKQNKIDNKCCLFFDTFNQFDYTNSIFKIIKNPIVKPNVLSFLYFPKKHEYYNFTNFTHHNITEFIKTYKIKIEEPMFVQTIHDKNWGNKLSQSSDIDYNSPFKFLLK